MNRISAGLSFAAALGLAATLGAQSPTTTTGSSTTTAGKDHEVTVTGCLSKTGGSYMLTNARMDTGASSSTTTAGSSTSTSTTTTAGTTGTSGRESAMASPAMSWKLSGDNDLEKHVGHKIQVTGKTEWEGGMDHSRPSTSTSTTASSTTTAKDAAEPHLDVKSIKMIASSCS